jgi:oligoendopeptidase F
VYREDGPGAKLCAMSAVTETDFPKVRWDLSALFTSIDDPKVEETLAWCKSESEAFASKYRGRISSENLDAQTLLEAVQHLERISNELGKPLNYAHLLFSADTGSTKIGAFLQKMQERSSEISVLLLFFELELQALPKTKIAELLADDSLANYRHYIGQVRAYSPFRLSEPEEIVLEKTANTGSRAWVRLFEEIHANYRYKLPTAEGVKEASEQEVLAQLRSSDRGLRQAAADTLTAGLEDLERVLVFTYNNLLQDKKIDDEMRNYNYPEESRHLANELDKSTVDLVVGMCVENYGLVGRFYDVKREILGLPQLTHVDRYAPLYESTEQVEFDRAKKIVLSSFAKFSEDMSLRANEFFDKDWIDAEPRKGKGGGAFCSYNTPDTHPVVFMSYLNRMDDVMTLAHELGHGVHASYSRAQTLFNFHGTLPLAELASTFGEMLVFDSLVKDASPKDKLSLYAEKIEGVFATIFRQAAMFRFELACHEKRRAEGELSAEEFGEIWQTKLQEMFGSSVNLGEQHSKWWSYVGHFIFAPFYVYAYSFGELLVLSLYQMAKKEGPSFASKYVELLKLGGSLTPKELMARVGVDLQSREFWSGGFAALEGLVAEFESLHSQVGS